MSKCKKCGNEFEPQLHRIEHCKKCFKKGLKKFINEPLDEVIKKQVKAVL